MGRVSNEEDTPGGGEPEGSRLDKIPTVKCGLEASENHGGHSSTGSAVRWRGNKARTPPQWSAAHKIPETFAGFQGIRDRVTSGREGECHGDGSDRISFQSGRMETKFV